MTGLSVYGIVPAGGRLRGARGALGEPLRLVAAGGVAAVVGDEPGTAAVDAEALRRHDAALRRLAARCGALLPARFGSRLPDDAAVSRLLETREAAFLEALALVMGREQMTLRLVQRAAASSAAPATEAERPAEPGALGAGAAYLAARRAAREVPEAEPLREAAAAVIVAERTRRHDRPPLVASLHHLVPRGQGDLYARLIRGAAVGLAPLQVTVSGPWPAYAFGPEEGWW